jgi:hypothetical protein
MLTTGFAQQTRVDTQDGVVVAIEVAVDPDVFLANREASGVVARHKKVVRGIALKTATVPLERWVELLTAALAKHANQSASAANALAQLTLTRRGR